MSNLLYAFGSLENLISLSQSSMFFSIKLKSFPLIAEPVSTKEQVAFSVHDKYVRFGQLMSSSKSRILPLASRYKCDKFLS